MLFTAAAAKVESNEAVAAVSSSASSSSAAAGPSTAAEPQPGTSSGITHSNGNGAPATGEEEEVNENLQFAWEVLEMAKHIFLKQGESHAEYLAETYHALGDISMENQNNSAAIEDYG